MSNTSFNGVNNNNISSSSIQTSSLTTSSLITSSLTTSSLTTSSFTCDSLTFSGSYSIITIGGTINYALTPEELFCMSTKGVIFVDSSGISGVSYLSLGDDTPARAAQLLNIFNLKDLTTKRLVKITPCRAHGNPALSIGTSSNTSSNNIQISSITSPSIAEHKYIFGSGSKSEAYMLVSKVGENKILFYVICQSIA